MIALEDPWTVAYLALHASLVLTVVAEAPRYSRSAATMSSEMGAACACTTMLASSSASLCFRMYCSTSDES